LAALPKSVYHIAGPTAEVGRAVPISGTLRPHSSAMRSFDPRESGLALPPTTSQRPAMRYTLLVPRHRGFDLFSAPASVQAQGRRAQDWPAPIQASVTPRMRACRRARREPVARGAAALPSLDRAPPCRRSGAWQRHAGQALNMSKLLCRGTSRCRPRAPADLRIPPSAPSEHKGLHEGGRSTEPLREVQCRDDKKIGRRSVVQLMERLSWAACFRPAGGAGRDAAKWRRAPRSASGLTRNGWERPVPSGSARRSPLDALQLPWAR